MRRNCISCGREFEGSSHQRLCPVCKAENEMIRAATKHKKKKSHLQGNMAEIERLTRLADEAGVSYGRFVARFGL